MAKGYPAIEKLHREGKAPRGADILGPLAVRYPGKHDPEVMPTSPRAKPAGAMETYKDYTQQFRKGLAGMHEGNPMPGMHYDIGHKMACGAKKANPMGKQHKFPPKKGL